MWISLECIEVLVRDFVDSIRGGETENPVRSKRVVLLKKGAAHFDSAARNGTLSSRKPVHVAMMTEHRLARADVEPEISRPSRQGRIERAQARFDQACLGAAGFAQALYFVVRPPCTYRSDQILMHLLQLLEIRAMGQRAVTDQSKNRLQFGLAFQMNKPCLEHRKIGASGLQHEREIRMSYSTWRQLRWI